jgi:hypothetical protein
VAWLAKFVVENKKSQTIVGLLPLLIYKDFYAPPLFPDIIHLDSVNLGIIPYWSAYSIGGNQTLDKTPV